MAEEPNHRQIPAPETQSRKGPQLAAAGLPALAILLYALLADGLIEAWVSGAATRWITTATVLVYGAASAMLWQRIPWSWKAAASSLLLLGLVAVSAWRLGSASAVDGFVLLGRSSAEVAAVALLLALALGYLVLWRSVLTDRRARMVVAILFLYAALPLAAALVRGGSLEGALRGEGFWEWPPFWLQGAYLAAAVLLPAALAVAFGLTFFDLVRGRVRPAMSGFCRGLALALAVLIALPSLQRLTLPHPLALLGISATPRAAPSAERPSETPAIAERARSEAEGLFALVEQARDQLPRTSFSPAAVVAAVGTDPEDLLRWVREETYLVPYRGALRGPRGVLMDRVGNSLDRALLLGALLLAAEHPARLLTAELSPGEADQLFEDAPEMPRDGASAGTTEEFDEVLVSQAEAVGLNGGDLEDRIEYADEQTEEIGEEIEERARHQAERVADAIGAPHDAVEPVLPTTHWWVQWQRDGTWRDLDPAGRGSEGSVVASAAPGSSLEAGLRDELLHRVQIRVVAEQVSDSGAAERVLLDHTLRALDNVGETLLLQHHPAEEIDAESLADADDLEERLRRIAATPREWVPVLFTRGGEVRGAKFGEAAAPAASGGGFGSPFERAMTALEDPTKSARVTAEWLDVEIHAPGEAPRTIRRELFDLRGPGARRAGETTLAWDQAMLEQRGFALMGEVEILVSPCHLSQAFVEDLSAGALLANREALSELAALGGFKSGRLEVAEVVKRIQRPPSGLYDLALMRHRSSPVRGKVFIDRPNLFAAHRWLDPTAGDSLSFAQAFDIVANGVGVRRGARDPFEIRVAQGVADTNAEALVLSRGGPVANTGALYAESSRGWVVVREAGDMEELDSDVDRDVRSRIAAELEAGRVVMLPKRAIEIEGAPQVAWWSVDPRSGATLGIGSRGWGEAGPEYATTMTWTLGMPVGGVPWYAGLIEYVIIFVLITICFWMSLIGSMSTTAREVFSDIGICVQVPPRGAPSLDELEGE